MPKTDRPFYVGYLDESPPGVARFLRPRIAVLLLLGPILLAGIAVAQKGFLPSIFEFGVEREFVGWMSAKPVPALISLRPGNSAHCGAVSTYPLVEFGKFGAAGVAAEFDGQRVRLKGTLSYLDDQTMIEISSGSVEKMDDATRRPSGRVESLGTHHFEGEIVDSKCYFGVMNPGTGKVHRACAARCISGGVPPAFLVRDPAGGRMTLLLVDEEGRSLGDRVLDRTSEPVAIRGEVIRHDDLLVLHADPDSIERLAR